MEDRDHAQIEAMIDRKLQGLASELHMVISEHRHDGYGSRRVSISDLMADKESRGRLPFSYRFESETDTDTLTSTAANLITAAITPHSTSNLFVIAWCQINNDDAAERTITLTLDQGGTLATQVVHLTADADQKHNACLFFLDTPETTDALTYALKGSAPAGSPTVTNKGIMVIEMPHRLSDNN